MGSHYIQVGKLKIDKGVLDLACPAAGYGETPPDPAIYCPAHGYTEPMEVWEPPVIIPDPQSEQILLLCDDLGQGRISLSCSATSGNIKFDVLTPDMNLLSSANNLSGQQIIFPTQDQGIYYVVRMTPVNVGQSIKSFSRNTWTGFSHQNWRILQAKFHTPNIENLFTAFRDVAVFSECLFYTDMNSLISAYYIFSGSNVQHVTFPSMNSLVNLYYAFDSCERIRTVKLPDQLPLLWRAEFMFQYSSIEYVEMPSSLPEVYNISGMFKDSKIKIPPEFTSLPKLTLIGSFLNGTKNLQVSQYTFPALPLTTGANTYIITGSTLKKLIFSGDAPNWGALQYLLDGARSLEELVFPPFFKGGAGVNTNWQSWQRNAINLKRIVMPLEMPDFFPYSYWTTSWPPSVEEITTCNDWGIASHRIGINSPMLKVFWQPALRVSQLTLGYSTTIPCQLTEVEVDWANSDYSYSSNGITIRAQLDAAEIDRIFTALPAMVKYIDVRFNPGFATCTPAIAQAKGWIVNGA